MKVSTIAAVYFSATYTTQGIVKQIAHEFGKPVVDYDITQSVPDKEIVLGKDELLIVGMPVYSGRIPPQAAQAFTKIKGNGTPAIIICVYGNRDYDDALIELRDITEKQGFSILAAAAFVARHSIFSQIATNRPDEWDCAYISKFGETVKELLEDLTNTEILSGIKVKGNYPYKAIKRIPIHPKTNDQCNKCGKCARLCPTQAISAENPQKPNKKKCISCGRCTLICPQKARNYGGWLYRFAGKKFIKKYSKPKAPECFFAEIKIIE